MTDQTLPSRQDVTNRQLVECGGLRFEATFRAPTGATLRVSAEVDGRTEEVLRFDDFIEAPHYRGGSATIRRLTIRERGSDSAWLRRG